MRYLLASIAISLALLLFAGDAVMAQTATPASPPSAQLSKRALAKQDRQECAKDVAALNIARRNQADVIRKCLADRQAERKAAAKKKASEESHIKRTKLLEEWTATELDQKKQQQRHADCNKQAKEQKLRLAKRWRFIAKCIAE
jgi:hypothetical protein